MLDAVRRHFTGQSAIAVVDLACGTGSTVRALGPYLPARQNWLLVDNDLSLLARAADSARPERAQVTAFFEGLTYPEIAARDGVSLGTVKSRAARAITALREALADDDPMEPPE